MIDNILKRYKVDELYIGVVTVYNGEGKRPECIKVDIPPDREYISYATILKKANEGAYIQIDNGQCCFLSYDDISCDSNFPLVRDVFPLKYYFSNYQHRDVPDRKRIGNRECKSIAYDINNRKMVL